MFHFYDISHTDKTR